MEATIPAAVLSAAETLWRYHCVYDALEPADAIIGFGSYDLRVADRCADLFLEGYAPRLLFTGAQGHWTRGRFDRSEAAIFASRAISLGLQEQDILTEERATNIGENIRFASAMLPGCRSVILVTKPQTQRRCLATAQRQWPQVHAAVTAPRHSFREQPIPEHGMTDLINEMVGDVERMRRYPALGYQTKQEEPPGVSAAYDLLVAAGYTGHIPGA